MATLADIIRKQRSSGSGVAGSLLSSVGMKTLEKIDPRRMFDRTGILTALFPSLKSYKAGENRVGKKVSDISSSVNLPSPQLEQMVAKLEFLTTVSNITARNSQSLPGMSRDMNIMRQNVVKLVKLQGGKASTRADAFFTKAFEREKLTESQLQSAKAGRDSGKTTSATEIKEGSSGFGGLGIIMGVFSTVATLGKKLIESIGSLKDVLAPLLKGGLSLIFDFAGSFAKLALKGTGTLLGFAGKSLATLLRGVASFLLNPAVLAAMPVAAVAGLLTYLLTSEKTQSGTAVDGYTPEDTTTPPPPPKPSSTPGKTKAPSPIPRVTPDEYQELSRARENMRRSSDPAVRAAAEKLDMISPLPSTKTPTPVPNNSVTPGEDGKLLDFIAAKESNGDYNAVYGQGSVPGLTNMTIAEVLEYQKRLIAMGQKSSAVGRYQFIRSTLEEEAKAAGVDKDKELFTPQMQDKLILNRLRRLRGLDKFRKGEITPRQFAENLSMEFASLPSPIKGGGTKSYYEGVAGNKSLTDMSSVYSAIMPKSASSQLAQASSENRSLTTTPPETGPGNVVFNDNKVIGNQVPNAFAAAVDKAMPYSSDFYKGVLRSNAI